MLCQRRGNLLYKTIRRAVLDDHDLYATVRFLLYAGCDPNAIDEGGNAPLHFLNTIFVPKMYKQIFPWHSI